MVNGKTIMYILDDFNSNEKFFTSFMEAMHFASTNGKNCTISKVVQNKSGLHIKNICSYDPSEFEDEQEVPIFFN